MDVAFLVLQLLHGCMLGLLLFLLASGLTLIFGLSGVVNFAHGSLYMLGAYLGMTLTVWSGNFWLSLLLAPAGIGLLGGLMEISVIRPIRHRDPLDSMLLTFGLTLVLDHTAKLIWGPTPLGLPPPSILSGSFPLVGVMYPIYRAFIIACAVVVTVLLFYLLERTTFGLLIRSTIADRDMAGVLGVHTSRLLMSVFSLGAALAGLSGVVVAPLLGLYTTMGQDIMIQAFAVLVMGGLGSFKGAVLAALVVGQVDSWGRIYLSEYTTVLIMVLMASVLLLRPGGILGEGRSG